LNLYCCMRFFLMADLLRYHGAEPRSTISLRLKH
jgi:hypothetical protein